MTNSNAPILITAYNRFENFKILIKSINQYKSALYISIDGPKNDYDKIQQSKIINLIKKIKKIKKNYKIKYRVLNKNLGCQKATFSSLDWFFSQEKEGIILEDDNLPSASFFKFCNQLLIQYRNNKNIFSISGYIPFRINQIKADYFFSKIFMSWGWATWRSRWLIVKKFVKKNKWKNLLKNPNWQLSLNNNIKKRYYKKIYNLILSNRIDSWSFLWLLIGVSHNYKFILPKYNLVKNTGTQTYGANYIPSNFEYANFKTHKFKIKNHPYKNYYDEKLDSVLFNYNFNPQNQLYPSRIIFIIKSLFFDPKFFFTKLGKLIKKRFK